MKRITLTSLIVLLLVNLNILKAQESNFSSIKLKSVSGKTIDFADLAASSKDTMVVLSFWATWCIPCITELEMINDEMEEKQAIRPFKFIGVSIDDSRTSQRVKPFIKGKGWKFEVLMDINSELKRALNITDVPHVLILKDNKIVYRHTGYIAGEEDNLFETIKNL
jgi:thiol-disulfide isomerase/thioredoxin